MAISPPALEVFFVEEPVSSTTVMAPSQAEVTTESLELRVRRLEDAVASLQDTRLLEERILDRLQRQSRPEAKTSPAGDSNTHIIAADPLPLAVGSPPAAPPPTPNELSPSTLFPPLGGEGKKGEVVKEAWLVVEIFRDLSAMFRMFFDMRYRVAWFARILTFIMVPLLLLASWWVPFASVPFVGGIWSNAVVVLLSFFLFKVLSREARRYQQMRRPAS